MQGYCMSLDPSFLRSKLRTEGPQSEPLFLYVPLVELPGETPPSGDRCRVPCRRQKSTHHDAACRIPATTVQNHVGTGRAKCPYPHVSYWGSLDINQMLFFTALGFPGTQGSHSRGIAFRNRTLYHEDLQGPRHAKRTIPPTSKFLSP
jgi:hypothetical protein